MTHSSFRIKLDPLFSSELQLNPQQISVRKFFWRWCVSSSVIQKDDIKQINLRQIFGQLQITLTYQNQSGKSKKIAIAVVEGDPQSLQLLAELKKIFPIDNTIDSKQPEFGDNFSLPLIIHTRRNGYINRMMYLGVWFRIFFPVAIYFYLSGCYKLRVSREVLSIRNEKTKKIPWENTAEVNVEVINSDKTKSFLKIKENYVVFDILTKQNESFDFILSPLNANKLIPLFINKRLLPKNLDLSTIGFIAS